MLRFDSDYEEGCIPQILERLSETNLEQTPGYGTDIYCARARKLIQKACGNPNADVHFLVGGTQTNAAVISSILKPYQGVFCANSGHINVHETGAVEHGGHKILELDSVEGKITAKQLHDAMSRHNDDCFKEHSVQPGMVYISFPTEDGALYSKSELVDISLVCKKWGLPLYIDGARLGYGLMSPACDVTLGDIACLADVFYIGGTKQGALFGEAVVFTNKALSVDFRYKIKQSGAMLAKGRLLGIQFETLFTDNLFFKYAENGAKQAMKIREAFLAKGVRLFNDSYTNQQFPILSNEQLKTLSKDFTFEVWDEVDKNHTAVRFVTSWATTDEIAGRLTDAIGKLPE